MILCLLLWLLLEKEIGDLEVLNLLFLFPVVIIVLLLVNGFSIADFQPAPQDYTFPTLLECVVRGYSGTKILVINIACNIGRTPAIHNCNVLKAYLDKSSFTLNVALLVIYFVVHCGYHFPECLQALDFISCFSKKRTIQLSKRKRPIYE